MWSVFPFAVPHLGHLFVSYLRLLGFLFDLMTKKHDFALVLPSIRFDLMVVYCGPHTVEPNCQVRANYKFNFLGRGSAYLP